KRRLHIHRFFPRRERFFVEVNYRFKSSIRRALIYDGESLAAKRTARLVSEYFGFRRLAQHDCSEQAVGIDLAACSEDFDRRSDLFFAQRGERMRRSVRRKSEARRNQARDE